MEIINEAYGDRWPGIVFGTLIAWTLRRGLRWCSKIGRVIEAARTRAHTPSGRGRRKRTWWQGIGCE